MYTETEFLKYYNTYITNFGLTKQTLIPMYYLEKTVICCSNIFRVRILFYYVLNMAHAKTRQYKIMYKPQVCCYIKGLRIYYYYLYIFA